MNQPKLLSTIYGELINLDTAITPSGLSYMYFVGGDSLFSSNPTIVLCSVELPFQSGSHLIGIPKNSATVFIDTNGYESVQLEGDYNDYFALFAAPQQQVQSRYILDPRAMVFTIDFCSSYYWEILDDTLYFISNGSLPTVELLDRFVAEIRPALEVPSDRDSTPAMLPYTFTEGRTLACPRCNKQLANGRAWLECPDGHGFLIRGSQMNDERISSAPIEYTAIDVEGDFATIRCPYCSSKMVRSAYQDTEIIIDICTKCPYRWIDGSEIKPILGN